MAFNTKEKEIIEYGLQNGKSQAEVKQALVNFRAGIVTQPAQQIAEPEITQETREPTFREAVTTDLETRADRVSDIRAREDISSAKKGFQVLGQGTGLAADVIEEGFMRTPVVKGLLKGVGKGFEWLTNSKLIQFTGDKIGDSKKLQELVTLYDSDPEFKDTVDATANIARLGLEVEGILSSPKFIKNVTNKVVDKTKKVSTGIKKDVIESVGDTRVILEKSAIKDFKRDWIRPTETKTATYKKPTQVYEYAKSKGHNIEDTLLDNKINLTENMTEGSFDTLDTVASIKADAGKLSSDLIRPVIKEIDLANPPIKGKLLKQKTIENIRKNKAITPEAKAKLIKKLDEVPFEETYTREALLDEKILRDKNANHSPVGDLATNAEAIKNKSIADAARDLLYKEVPEGSTALLEEVNAEATKLYQMADYLEALDTKKVPRTMLQKISAGAAKIGGAVVGVKLGGGLGVEGLLPGVAGYHLGGLLERVVSRMSNPIKSSYLKSIQIKQPAVFNRVKQFLGEAETARLLRLQLKAPAEISIPLGGKTGTSSVQSVPATKNPVSVNPKTGKFQTSYSSQ